MTLTGRKNRFEIIFKLNCKTSEEVINKFNQIKDFIKLNYNKAFLSLSLLTMVHNFGDFLIL